MTAVAGSAVVRATVAEGRVEAVGAAALGLAARVAAVRAAVAEGRVGVVGVVVAGSAVVAVMTGVGLAAEARVERVAELEAVAALAEAVEEPVEAVEGFA